MKINAHIIAGRMKESGRTQDSLAQEIGVTRRTISEILRKGEIARVDTLIRIAEVLGLLMADIVEGVETMESQAFAKTLNATPSQSSEIRNMWMIPASAKGLLLSNNSSTKKSLTRVAFPFLPTECFAFEIEGYEMFIPSDCDASYPAGSWIIAKKTNLEPASLLIGSIYLFQTEQEIFPRMLDAVIEGQLHLKTLTSRKSVISVSDVKQIYTIELRLGRAKVNGFNLS